MSISQIIQQITENSLSELQESVDIECKFAGGKDGKGELPNSFWDSYSAFANTNGGVVILGVKEIKQNNTFEVSGIERVQLPNHPADITKMLQHLVKQGMLVSTGGRWAIYSLASANSLAGSEISLAGNNPSYPNNDPRYPNNDAKILEDTDLISVANPARRKKDYLTNSLGQLSCNFASMIF